MAGTCTEHVQCPECDVLIPIVMTLKPTTRNGDSLIIDVEPDLTAAVAPAWTHEAPASGLA